MKTLTIGLAAFLISMNAQAQNQNVTQVSKTTVTTVKDSKGEQKTVKTQDVQEVQKIELKDPDSKSLNKEMKETPVEVTSVTQVTNPDGSTRTVDVDHSSYYMGEGKKYRLDLDPMGYKMTSDAAQKPALLRKTSINSYIYRANSKTSIGYFDTEGNLILETYDDKSDKVSIEKYQVVKP